MTTLEHEVILSSESNEILMEYPVHLVSVWKSTGAQGKRSECLPKGGATVEEASVFLSSSQQVGIVLHGNGVSGGHKVCNTQGRAGPLVFCMSSSACIVRHV